MRSRLVCVFVCFFFFNDTATTEIYTLSLHDALPIYAEQRQKTAQFVLAQRIEGDPGGLPERRRKTEFASFGHCACGGRRNWRRDCSRKIGDRGGKSPSFPRIGRLKPAEARPTKLGMLSCQEHRKSP